MASKSEETAKKMVAETLRQQEEYLKQHKAQFDSSIYQQAMKSYENFQEEIDRLSKSGYLDSVLQKTPSYGEHVEKLILQLGDDKSVLNSLNTINSLTSSIQNDVHRYKVDEIMKKDMQISAQLHRPENIIENPIKEVIRQNKLLNEFAETRNSLLSNIYDRLNEQQESMDEQKELIRLQLDQKDKEIKDNNKWLYRTLFITFISLCVSGYYGWSGVDTAEKLSIEENKSDDEQHKEMMSLFQKSIENQQKIDSKLSKILTHEQNRQK
jgi:tetratricopeptide (TPR) repeat protein